MANANLIHSSATRTRAPLFQQHLHCSRPALRPIITRCALTPRHPSSSSSRSIRYRLELLQALANEGVDLSFIFVYSLHCSTNILTFIGVSVVVCRLSASSSPLAVPFNTLVHVVTDCYITPAITPTALTKERYRADSLVLASASLRWTAGYFCSPLELDL